jgi:hypothetical protein
MFLSRVPRVLFTFHFVQVLLCAILFKYFKYRSFRTAKTMTMHNNQPGKKKWARIAQATGGELRERVIIKLHGHRWGVVGEAYCKIIARCWIEYGRPKFNMSTYAHQILMCRICSRFRTRLVCRHALYHGITSSLCHVLLLRIFV